MSEASFDYRSAHSVADALAQAGPASAFLAGGTDLLQLWKSGLATPTTVVDISRLPLAEVAESEGVLSLGATARLADVAAHPVVAQGYPLIAEALAASASAQVRNMASVGGNLLQRTRCPYFRSVLPHCNKRAPASGCGALAGENRGQAIFGGSEACVATHPSDLAVALSALGASVRIEAAGGGRTLTLDEFYRLPADTPERDTVLSAGELIVAVEAPEARRFAARSTYLKVRDRASFEFAVVSLAAALVIKDGVVAEARLAAGGVAPKPWRLAASEAALVGRPPDGSAFEAAAALAVEGAEPLAHNAFKVELLRRSVIRALETIGGAA